MADENKNVHNLEFEKWLRWKKRLLEAKYLALALEKLAVYVLRIGGAIVVVIWFYRFVLGK